jgi:hypothetical protein
MELVAAPPKPAGQEVQEDRRALEVQVVGDEEDAARARPARAGAWGQIELRPSGAGRGVPHGAAQPGHEVARMPERAAFPHDRGDPAQEVPADAEPRPERALPGPAAIVAYGSVAMHPEARVTNVISG